jgi:hypothetical protein
MGCECVRSLNIRHAEFLQKLGSADPADRHLRDKANLVIWTPNWLYLLLLACSFSIGSMDIGFMEYCSVVDGMVENESELKLHNHFLEGK